MSNEPFDLKAAQALVNAARDKQRAEAPTNRRELEGYLIYAIGLGIAACYPSGPQAPDGQQNRFHWLWEYDPTFHAAVTFAVTSTLRLIDDYARATGQLRVD